MRLFFESCKIFRKFGSGTGQFYLSSTFTTIVSEFIYDVTCGSQFSSIKVVLIISLKEKIVLD